MSEFVKDNENITPEEAEAVTPDSVDESVSSDEDGKLKGSDKKKLRKIEAELVETKKALETTTAALAEEKDKYLRMLAEYDNFRRRTAKEKESIYTDATADAILTMLPVLDNLERAAAATPNGEQESAFAQGVALTLKSAMDAFAKLGVEVIETETFDPNLHNAVMHVDDESLPEGAIVDVFQKGYKKGDHVIRYAMVKVAN